MPLDRDNGEMFTPPQPQPEQPAAAPRPETQPQQGVPAHGLRPLPPGQGMRPAAGVRLPPAQLHRNSEQPPQSRQPQHSAPRPRREADTYVGPTTSRRTRATVLGLLAVGVFGGGGAVADVLFDHGRYVDAAFSKLTDLLPKDSRVASGTPAPRTHTAIGSESSETPSDEPTTEEDEPSSTATTTHPTPTATPTHKPTGSKLAIPLTQEGCVQAMPLDVKVGQLVESTIGANSDTAELKKIALKYHLGSWLILKYPTQVDGQTPDINAIADLKSVDKNLPTLMTIDGEGGEINRLPGATIPMSPDKASATSPSPIAFQAQLGLYDEQLKKAGVDVNLAPVADINTTNTDAANRMFRTSAAAGKYMPSYVGAAKGAGVTLTFKHFPQVLEYGNTDLNTVTTPSYDTLLKSGVLDSYKLVKGTNNWVMMGNANTPGFPNKKLDNGKIAVFNPAAYDAAKQLTGDALFITDALNAKAVTDVMPQAEATARAINAGADIALIVPRDGKAEADTVAALDAIEKNVSKTRINEAFMKVLAAKVVSPCVLLAAEDSRYVAPQTTGSSPKTPTAPTAPITFPAMPNPSATPTKTGTVATATTKPIVKVTAGP
jgi:beta-N-acetylhexosaminidase